MVRGSPLAERRRLRSVQGSVIKGGCVGVFKGILERGRSRRGAGSGRGGECGSGLVLVELWNSAAWCEP